MKYEHITTTSQLAKFVNQLSTASYVAWDTEFVSEFTYRPDLCLIQVATDAGLAIIDPKELTDLSAFWEQLVHGDHQTIVHAGREEFRFCRNETGRVPKHWFDIQLAAGFVGLEYPASYGKLLAKLLGHLLDKSETRTDWRRRPLTEHQQEYALQDVIHLAKLRDELTKRLRERDRMSWFEDETKLWQTGIIDADTRPRWPRVAGISGLRPQSLVIVKHLWQWREEEAQRRDCPPKRVLRDDLLVELARRRKSSIKSIRAIRGLERGDLRKHFEDISTCIAHALDAPLGEFARQPRGAMPNQIALISQFLNAALTSICRSNEIAPTIVATVQDIRDLIAHHMRLDNGDSAPALATGWRSEFIGRQMEELLLGEKAIRIVDLQSNKPLAFESLSK